MMIDKSSREWINARQRALRLKNPEKARARARKSYQKNKGKIRAQEKLRHKLNPEMARQYDRKRHYGITADEYERRVLEQGGRCAICLDAPTNKGLAVDHDHKTRAIRGLLCTRCNPGIGMFRDNPELLKKAVAYLERNSTPVEA